MYVQLIYPDAPAVPSANGWSAYPSGTIGQILASLGTSTDVRETGSVSPLDVSGVSPQGGLGRRRHGVRFYAQVTASGGTPLLSVPVPQAFGFFAGVAGADTPTMWTRPDEWQTVATPWVRPANPETFDGDLTIYWKLMLPTVIGGGNTRRFATVWAEVDWRDKPTVSPSISGNDGTSSPLTTTRQAVWSFGDIQTDGLPIYMWSVQIESTTNGTVVWEQSGVGAPPVGDVDRTTDPLPNGSYRATFRLSSLIADATAFTADETSVVFTVDAPSPQAPETSVSAAPGQTRVCWWAASMPYDTDDVLIEIQRQARCGGDWSGWERVASLDAYGEPITTPNLLTNVFFLELAASRPVGWVTDLIATEVIDGFPGESAISVDVEDASPGSVVVASNPVPVPPTGPVTASAYVRTMSTTPVGQAPMVAIRWRTVTGAILGMSPGVELAQQTGWNRVETSGVPPEGATTMELVLTSGWLVGEIVLGRPQLELGPVASPFAPSQDAIVASGCWDDLTVPVGDHEPGCGHDTGGCCVAYRTRFWGIEDDRVVQSEWSTVGDTPVTVDPWYGAAQMFTSGSTHIGTVSVGQIEGTPASAMLAIYLSSRSTVPSGMWRTADSSQSFTMIDYWTIPGEQGMTPRTLSIWLINSAFPVGTHQISVQSTGTSFPQLPAFLAMFPLSGDVSDPKPFEVQDIDVVASPGNANPTLTLDPAAASTARFGIIYGDYPTLPTRRPGLGMRNTAASSPVTDQYIVVDLQEGQTGAQDLGWDVPAAHGVAVGVAVGPAPGCIHVPTPPGTDWLSVPSVGISLPVCPDVSFTRERPLDRSQPSTGGPFTVTTGPPSRRVYELSRVVVTPEQLAALEAILSHPRVFYRPAHGPGVWASPSDDSFEVTKIGRRVEVSFSLTVVEPFPTMSPAAHYG